MNRSRGKWAVFATVVIVAAVLQGLLVITDPGVEPTVGFVLLVLASAIVLAVEVWCISGAAVTPAGGSPRDAWGRVIRRSIVLAWSLGLIVLLALAAVFALALVPVVLLAGVLLLPPVAAGARNPFAAVIRAVRRHPWRFVLLVLGVVLTIVLGWVAAMLLGFFVTGPIAAFLTWLWIGGSIVLVLSRSSAFSAAPRE
jgi:hypothetical protein